MTDAETQQRIANELRRKCWSYLQSINAASPNESLNDWRRLKRKTREAWLWIAREMNGENPE